MADILDILNKKELNQFSRDFKELIRVAFGMGKAYRKATEKLTEYMSKYKALIELFNKKYNGIKIKIFKSVDELNLVVLLNEKSIKDLFTNVASKISGLRSLGLKGFDEVSLEETEKFTNKIANIKDELYLSYYYPEKGTDSIHLKFNGKGGMIELSFDFDIIIDEKSAEFKFCAYYALQDFDDKIDFYNEAASFGFVDVLTKDERRKFLNKFEPGMLE